MKNHALQRGSQMISRHQLCAIPIPKTTKSYNPIPYDKLSNMVKTMSCDYLRDHKLVDEQYIVARDGLQLMGTFVFRKDDNPMGIVIVFQSSYDKSSSAGISTGVLVFSADYMLISKGFASTKKHTEGAWESLENAVASSIFKSRKYFSEIEDCCCSMKNYPMNNTDAFMLLGLLFGEGVLSPRQLTAARNEWLNSKIDALKPRNKFSLMGIVMRALKTTPPTRMIEKHADAYRMFTSN